MTQSTDSNLSAISALSLRERQQSLLNTIDPRARILMAGLFAISVVLSQHFLPLFIALSVAICSAFFAKLAMHSTLKKIAAMDVFMLYLIVMLPFTKPGETMFVVWGFEASWQGLEQGLKIALKANTVVLMLLALVANLSSSALGSALDKLNVSNKLIQLLLFTLRYLQLIGEEYQRLRQSMRARAFVMGFNLHTWKSMGYLIAMLILRSMQRSERVVKAMKCRGYQGTLHYSYPLQWQTRDSVFCLFFLSLSSILTIIYFLMT